MNVLRFPSFEIFGFVVPQTYVPSYMFAFYLAVAVTFIFAIFEAKRQNYSRKKLVVFMLLSWCSAMVFGRIFYAIFFRSFNFSEGVQFFFDLSKSGLASSGAIFGILIVCLIYSRFTNIWKLLDIASIGMMLSMAIGRLGCFVVGCCHGIATDVPWAVFQHEMFRHPTQLYDMASSLLIFGIVQRLRLFPGSVFLANVALYSLGRFVIEFFRVGPMIGFLTFSQWFYLGLFLISAYLFKHRSFRSVLD